MNLKQLVITVGALLIAVAAHAQGTINFNNRIPGLVDARITLPDNTGAGAGFTAQLLAGPSASNLTPIGTTDFRTSSAAAMGYVNGVTLTVPGIAPGAQAFVQVRAYNGASYETSSLFGESDVIQVTLGGVGTPPGPAADLVGLTGFQLVPEPSTIALGILGAAGLFLIRRRK